MKFFSIIFSACAAGVLAQNGYVNRVGRAAPPFSIVFKVFEFLDFLCGFPDGPDCKSLGKGANGLEQFADPDGCCLLPLRCGNGDGGERCEHVSGASAGNTGNNTNTGKKTRKNNRKRRL
ncbi:hypothetical protein CGLO_08389 [Colletotrichum gloeosporioides Cg-14]|uniref:Uncharacterized protein n=1 Tax=Colletotrichum gloeosporioides (strain Cg-14) TaxID=1237896 RepID=T0KGF5_COLGC|nr:hypothetical protein CGLO_08389 [Colletotrichum gloeosporioides Cg-14]